MKILLLLAVKHYCGGSGDKKKQCVYNEFGRHDDSALKRTKVTIK